MEEKGTFLISKRFQYFSWIGLVLGLSESVGVRRGRRLIIRIFFFFKYVDLIKKKKRFFSTCSIWTSQKQNKNDERVVKLGFKFSSLLLTNSLFHKLKYIIPIYNSEVCFSIIQVKFLFLSFRRMSIFKPIRLDYSS